MFRSDQRQVLLYTRFSFYITWQRQGWNLQTLLIGIGNLQCAWSTVSHNRNVQWFWNNNVVWEKIEATVPFRKSYIRWLNSENTELGRLPCHYRLFVSSRYLTLVLVNFAIITLAYVPNTINTTQYKLWQEDSRGYHRFPTAVVFKLPPATSGFWIFHFKPLPPIYF